MKGTANPVAEGKLPPEIAESDELGIVHVFEVED
jgi:hypothetical protein